MWKVIAIVSFVAAAPSKLNSNFAAINKFTLKLLDNTYTFEENFGRKNIVTSPLSVWSIFGLLAEGSTGETFEELVKELRLPNDMKSTQTLHATISDIINVRRPDLFLNSQSAIFTDFSLRIHEDFGRSAKYYNADVFSVDPSNTTKLADDINYYICEATEGRILKVVNPSVLKNLRMILIDVLYLKAIWTYPFDPTHTKEEAFYNSEGKTIGSVNMMYHKAQHNIIDSDLIGARVIELTYGRNEQFSMLLLLPYDGMSLKVLLNNLATQSLHWMEDLRKFGSAKEVGCFVPRFKISVETNLIPPLQYGGIQRIFDAALAELPGVSDTPLFVSKALQNVAIEVTEEGTVAAASTVVGLKDRMLGQRFDANKEFVFLVVNRETDLILLSGVFTDPNVY